MDTSTIIFAIELALLSLQLTTPNQAQSQVLTATECSARLPAKRYHLTGLYDKDDTIYLFGGYNNITGSTDQTLRYSISEDKIEAAGRLPFTARTGAALMNKQGSIFYIPGAVGTYCNDDIPILQYFPESGTFVRLSNIAENPFSACVTPDEDRAFLFGGYCHGSNMAILDMNNLALEVFEDVLSDPTSAAAGIWVEKQEAGYIFHTGSPSVQKFSKASNRTDIVPVHMGLKQVPQAVWDGKYGYLIGGANREDQESNNFIIQFYPDTETYAYRRVEGYPEEGVFAFTSAVYVEKLNRVYMFGGVSTGDSPIYYDKIWYISLDPLNPPPSTTTNAPIPTVDPGIFDCAGRPNGNYAFPGDCAKFIVCLDDHGYPFECQEPLLFHPINRGCTLPQLVDCHSSCFA